MLGCCWGEVDKVQVQVQLSIWLHTGGSWFWAEIPKLSYCGSVSECTAQCDCREGAGDLLG